MVRSAAFSARSLLRRYWGLEGRLERDLDESDLRFLVYMRFSIKKDSMRTKARSVVHLLGPDCLQMNWNPSEEMDAQVRNSDHEDFTDKQSLFHSLEVLNKVAIKW